MSPRSLRTVPVTPPMCAVIPEYITTRCMESAHVGSSVINNDSAWLVRSHGRSFKWRTRSVAAHRCAREGSSAATISDDTGLLMLTT